MKPANTPKTQHEQEAMFGVYCEHPSIYFVAKVCKVSPATAKKYLVKNRWVERLDKIKKKAEAKADETEVQRRARHKKEGKLLQSIGTKKYIKPDGTVDEGVAKKQTPTEATRNIELGIKIELEAVGEPSEKTERKLIVEFVSPNGEEDKNEQKAKKQIEGTPPQQ